MNQRGFTLTELLVAVAISMVVAAAGYTFYATTYMFSVEQGRAVEMQRDLRIGLDMLSRDIRAAGYGVIEPLSGDVWGAASPIQANNNVDPEPSGTANQLDRIRLVGGYLLMGTLSGNTASGATQITVALAPGVDPESLDGATFTIDGFYYGTATRVGTTGSTYTVSPALNRAYTSLDSVFVVQTITYGVEVPAGETEPVLYRQVGAGTRETVATGVEDLQFAYLLADGTETNSPTAVAPPALPPIRGVRVTLVARSLDPSPSAAAVSTRPAVEDHAAAATADRYHRRVLTKVVEVRNFGLGS